MHHVHCFLEILTTVSKVCKICVLQLGPSNIGFNFTEKAVNGGTKLWCELQQVQLCAVGYKVYLNNHHYSLNCQVCFESLDVQNTWAIMAIEFAQYPWYDAEYKLDLEKYLFYFSFNKYMVC